MFAYPLEMFCIQLGYFDCQFKITSLPGFYALGRLFSLLLVIYPYSCDINSEFKILRSEVIENRFYSLLQLLIDIINQIFTNPTFQNYIQFIFNLIFVFGIGIVLTINNITKDTIEENFRKQNLINFIMKSITFFFISISVTLQIPLLVIVLQNLIRLSKVNNYTWFFNDIIYLMIIHFIQLFYFILLEGTLIVKQGICKKLSINFQDFVILLLQMIQPYIFVFSSTIVAIYGQSIIFILITLLELFSIYIYQQYSNKIYKYLLLIIHSCGIIIAICSIIKIDQPMIYLILLSPLLLYIGIYVHNYLEFSILTQNYSKLNLHQVNNLICSSLSAQKQQFQQNCILNSIYLYRHLQQCQNVKCQCQLYDQISSNTNKMNIIPDIIEEELYCGLLDRMKRLIQNQEPQDCFYYLIHYLYAQQYNGEVYEIYSKVENKLIQNNLTYLQRIKWKLFIMMIKQNLYTNLNAKLNGNHLDKTQLSLKINQFVRSESFNQNIKDGLVNIIQQKIQLQLLLIKSQNKINFIYYYNNLIENVETQEKILKSIYDQFPSQRNQSQLMFFYAEIKNDWKKAFDQLQINAIDNSILSIMTDIELNRLVNKMSYLIYSYDDQKLKIISYSKKAPILFGYQQHQFEFILRPDTLIPVIVRDIHDQYIQDFLQSGKGNYFRQAGQNYCQHKSGFIQNIEFFFDIYFDSNHSFRFITFISCYEQSDPIILIDSNTNKIQGINKELLKKLNFHPKIIEQLNIEKSLYNLSADLFINNNILYGNKDQYSFLFYFPKDSFFSQEYSTYTQKITNLKNNSKLLTYEVNCEVLRRKTYKIIQFKKIQEYSKSNSSIEIHFNQNQNLIVNDEESIIIPYENSLQKELSSNIIIQTQRKADVRILHEIDQDDQDIDQILQAQMYNYSESNIIDIDNKTIKILGNVYDDDARNQENIVLEGSQASSMAGLRKSIYYRKYTLVNQLNDQTIIIPLLNKVFGYFIFALINQVIFLLINISYSRIDFHSLNYYYQSIQINHYFIEPMQKFFLTRYMLQDYQMLNLYQSITKDKLNYYQQFINPLLIGSYDEFKLNFQDHFQDETFSEFIKNQYVIIQQQTYHYAPLKLQEYNVTLFNAFSILLDAFYKQEQIYIKPQTTRGTNPHNTYQYKNYLLFVTVFDNISNQMYQESIKKIELVVNKWIIMVIPISITVILSIFFFGFYYNQFNNYLEKFFGLKKYIDQMQLDADQNRQQFILQSLKQGSELIHLYKFNMNSKEDILAKFKIQEDNKQEVKNINNEIKEIKQHIKISKLPLISTIFILVLQYVLIVGPLTYIGSEYMNKFQKSIHFFKSISDIGVYVPASFSQKEILYFFSYFTYYTIEDRTFFVDQIQKAVTKIDTFLKMDIDTSQLQFSNQFLESYEYLQQNNLCPLLNSSKYFDFDYFCSNSQNGILKLGLRVALTNFNNILKTELSINFPNTRKLPPKEELEAVYLCSDIISEITSEMEQDIQLQTQIIEQLYNIINSISLTYTIILILIVYFLIFQLFRLKLNRTKMISLIFPLETIFLNDHFERELRRIVTSEKLI